MLSQASLTQKGASSSEEMEMADAYPSSRAALSASHPGSVSTLGEGPAMVRMMEPLAGDYHALGHLHTRQEVTHTDVEGCGVEKHLGFGLVLGGWLGGAS